MIPIPAIAVSALAQVAAPPPAPPPARPSATQHVALTVTAKSEAGVPVSDVWFFMASYNERFGGKTDGDGVARLEGDVKAGEPRLLVTMGANPDVAVRQRALDLQTLKKVWTQYSVPTRWLIPLSAEKSEYKLDLVLPRAVKVRGRLLDAQGRPIRNAQVYQIGRDPEVRTGHDGRFELGGVRAAADQIVIVYPAVDSSHLMIRVTAEQSSSDVELGDVTYTPVAVDATVAVAVSGRDAIPLDFGSLDSRVSLVSTDGQRLHGFLLDREGVAHGVGMVGDPKVPAGEYFVVLGGSLGNMELDKVVRVLRAGRADEVAAAGVTKVTATKDARVTLKLEAAALDAAVRAVRE